MHALGNGCKICMLLLLKQRWQPIIRSIDRAGRKKVRKEWDALIEGVLVVDAVQSISGRQTHTVSRMRNMPWMRKRAEPTSVNETLEGVRPLLSSLLLSSPLFFSLSLEFLAATLPVISSRRRVSPKKLSKILTLMSVFPRPLKKKLGRLFKKGYSVGKNTKRVRISLTFCVARPVCECVCECVCGWCLWRCYVIFFWDYIIQYKIVLVSVISNLLRRLIRCCGLLPIRLLFLVDTCNT